MSSADDTSPIASHDKAPYLAASLILVDQSHKSEPKFLLGRRHDKHVFLPGKFVFPGGRSETEDAAMSALGPLAPEISQKLRDPARGVAIADPRALSLTAIRELFEETGHLFGDRTDEPFSAPKQTTWSHFVAARVIPNLARLHYVARALTPPGLPRRFDTHFFTADVTAIAATLDGYVHADAELVELRWATIAEISTLDILPVTHFITLELAQRLAAGLGHDGPVPYFHMQDDRWIRTEF